MGIEASGTFRIGGDLAVHRLGYGAMRLCGPGVWGHPRDRAGALDLLRRATDLGVDLIDTADAYGPEVNEYQIADALHPYSAGLVVATKGGLVRSGPDHWGRDGHPERLRRCVANSLRRLRRRAVPERAGADRLRGLCGGQVRRLRPQQLRHLRCGAVPSKRRAGSITGRAPSTTARAVQGAG